MHSLTTLLTRYAARLLHRCLPLACLAGAPALALDPNLRLANYHHTTWTAKEGAPARIGTMAQTRDGWLWLGTQSGLYRFDGITFSKFVAVDGSRLLATSISNLYAQENGDLLIGYIMGGLSVLRNDTVVHLRELGEMRASYQADIDVDGSLWVGATGGLHRYRAGAWTTFGAAQGFAGPNATNVTLDHYGRLWTNDGEHLYLFDRALQRFTRYDLPGGASAIVPSPDGRVWRGVGGEWQALPLPPKTAPVPMPAWRAPSASAGGLFDRNGNHWALRCPVGLCHTTASRLRGIDRFQAEAVATDRLDQPWQLSNLAPTSILEDQEGNIWVGTQAGLERFRHNKLITVPLPANESWFDVFTDQDGRALLHSRSRGHLFPAGAATFGKQAARVEMASGWDGGLLRADHLGVTHVLDGASTFIPYPREADGTPVGKMPTLVQGQRDELWLTFRGKGLFHFHKGKWTSAAAYGVPRGLMGLSKAPDGAVWIGFRDGSIIRFDEGKTSRFNVGDPAGFGPIIHIDASDGIVLAGEEWLAVLDQGRVRKLRSADPEALAGISGQIVGADGERWFNGRRGAVQAKAQAWKRALANPDALLEVRVFDNLDGYPGTAVALPNMSTAASSRDGRLWFVGSEGVAYLDPARIHRNTVAPAVVIAPLDVAGARRRPDGGLTLPPNTTGLRLDYTALSYAMPERLRFRYRLDGVDRDWQDAGSRRMAFYTRLDPGAYRFRVMAFNEDGVPSEREASIAFDIAPTLVQTWWFRLACGLALLLLAAAVFRWRTRMLARRYAQRYRERLAERERIARALHDSLLQNVQGLVLRLNTALLRMTKGSAAHGDIEAILDQADAVMTEAREELADLRAQPGPAAQDLGPALAAFGQALQEQCGPRFALQIVGTPRRLADVAHHELYTLGREALFNAFRHAEADRIEVELGHGGESFTLTVRDDGRGIDPAILCAGGRGGHWGLPGMRERACALGGTLEVSTPAQGGTAIVVRIPARIAYARPARPRLHQRLLGLLGRPATS
ncbi:sensor histidine kinase [Telluria beijingensis]|uniref:sensor histidine kinase n=1 Tax=Telluria beijingensis TaxID=3068633 RepID=UPI002795BD20|nr:sensor histidine kinase [Massilia sp. REN29]